MTVVHVVMTGDRTRLGLNLLFQERIRIRNRYRQPQYLQKQLSRLRVICLFPGHSHPSSNPRHLSRTSPTAFHSSVSILIPFRQFQFFSSSSSSLGRTLLGRPPLLLQGYSRSSSWSSLHPWSKNSENNSCTLTELNVRQASTARRIES
jgi:hypothetical protein